MNGLARIDRVLHRQPVDRAPVLPIAHSVFPGLLSTSLGDYFSNAATLADVTVRAARELHLDGVQMSTGVTMEPEALGAAVEQPVDAAPILREYLLRDLSDLSPLAGNDPTTAGRAPMYHSAVRQVVREIGDEIFVLATLRGPLLMASQLRGVETLMLDLMDDVNAAGALLDATTDIALKLGRWMHATGCHGLIYGEATCSPNFISPTLYHELVLPRHQRLLAGLSDMGFHALGFHVCGNTMLILDDLISTGASLLDIDYQVPAAKVIEHARGRVTLRGNLDPASLLRFGTPDQVFDATRQLVAQTRGHPWILSSGCDIPPGTPRENLHAFIRAAGAR